MEFKQIFDFQFKPAQKLENSMYLEDLTGLLAKVATSIDDESSYFFGDEFYLKNYEELQNNSFEHFNAELKSVFHNGSNEKIYIIRGRAGIGKSLFFERGIQRLLRVNKSDGDSYIYMGVNFKNVDNDEKITFYENLIYEKLEENAIDNIWYLGTEIFEDYREKSSRFIGQRKTPHTYLFPLRYFSEVIYNKYRKPCIIVFDNIDLASVKTQRNVFDATVNVCNAFNKFMKRECPEVCYRMFFVIRPETHIRYNEGQWGNIIDFPLPNILKISLAIIRKALTETAHKFDEEKELSCNVECQDIMSQEEKVISLNTYGDVAEYFYAILDYYLQNIWNSQPYIIERLGTNVEFHCNIVNYNLRMFLRFLADTISNGGFKPFTKEFNQQRGVKYYSVYDYIEMIIRGKWLVHPGNKNIDGEGGNKAPIVFNIFDTSLYGHNQRERIKHFMLNIRILQYFFLCKDSCEIYFGEMKHELSHFFDEENICNATKKLVYVRLLYSYAEGDEAIAAIRHWQDVSLDDETQLMFSPAGQFYLESLICEFEYLYQMALSSPMCMDYVNELQINAGWRVKKELVVLYFLKSIFEIIKINIQSYSDDNLFVFKNLFYYIDDSEDSRPFRRMLSGFISVMNNKVQRAIKRETGNIDNLNNILKQAEELEVEVTNYFKEKLG